MFIFVVRNFYLFDSVRVFLYSLLYNGNRIFPGRKERPGRYADPSPPSTAMVKKE